MNMITKVMSYLKATHGHRSMRREHQIASGLSADEFISIYDNYHEWCMIIAALVTTHDRLNDCDVKNMIEKLFERNERK